MTRRCSPRCWRARIRPWPRRCPAPQPPVVAVPDAAAPPAADTPDPEPSFTLVPEEAFPTIAELDALLADSHAPEPGLDAAARAELAEALGLDPTLADDADAFTLALAALEPPPEDDLPDQVSGEPSWDPAWVETVREDWALG